MSMTLSNFERITETIIYGHPGDLVDYSINVLEREGLASGDEVLLAIRNTTEKVVLIGGNALQLTVESGVGILHTVDVANGQSNTKFLYPGCKEELPAKNIMYWYKNSLDTSRPLVVRDHCDDFDPANEPTVSELLKGLISTYSGHIPA